MLISFPAETRTLIDNVRWETYVALASDRRNGVPQINYDQGLMELMSPQKAHEKIKTLLGRLVAAYAEAMEVDIESVASTTFRREDLNRGFEGDESFYITHAESMRGKEDIDLAIDPPPELVIEVEITASAIRKLELFAKFGVAEVWRHDGERFQVFHLKGDQFEQAPASRVVPDFPIAQVQTVIQNRNTQGEITLVKAFRESLENSRS
jgi:Uma2 family endonuclease